MAIRICPDLSHDQNAIDFNFTHFSFRYKRLSKKQVRAINQLIVRCAETMVFYQSQIGWVPKFIERNTNYRIEPRNEKIQTPEGVYLIMTHDVKQID